MRIIRDRKIQEVRSAPEGKILIATSGSRTQYYLRRHPSEKTGKYISKKNKETIKRYLQKTYNEKVINLLNEEISNLESFLKKSNKCVARIREQYSVFPEEIKEIVEPIDMSDEDFAKRWQAIPFCPKEIVNCRVIHETDKKEIVRSKSEMNIANALYKAGIPYKYECPLVLKGNIVIHPDFTTLNVRTRRIYYWEHRGMMDDREYAKDSVVRIKDMQKDGIILGKNLIITEETAFAQLGTDEIDLIINTYLK